MAKQEPLPKGVVVAKFDFTKTFKNQLFSHISVIYHQFSITNHSESILKSKIMSILLIIFVVVFFYLLLLLLYVPSQQLWSLRDGQFT